jgi:hypothetical protein
LTLIASTAHQQPYIPPTNARRPGKPAWQAFFLLTEVPEKDAVLNKMFFLYGAKVDAWYPKGQATLSLFLQEPDYKVVSGKIRKTVFCGGLR